MTCRWTGSATWFSEGYPLLITETCCNTHFMINFGGERPILAIFRQFLDNPPMFMENCQKRDPCSENFGPETHPYGRHILVPSTCYVPPWGEATGKHFPNHALEALGKVGKALFIILIYSIILAKQPSQAACRNSKLFVQQH